MSDHQGSMASDRTEFTYRTQLVIYNFLRLVPASVSPSDESVDDVQDSIEAMAIPHQTHNRGDMVAEHLCSNEVNEQPAQLHQGRDHSTVECKPRKISATRMRMLAELKDKVAALENTREAALRESQQKVPLNRQVLGEFMAKVREREQRLGITSVTVIKKKNKLKVLMAPPSPPILHDGHNIQPALMTRTNDNSISSPPLLIPQASSTPAVNLPDITNGFSSLTPIPSAAGDAESSEVPIRPRAAERTSSCVSEASSTYIDINELDDVRSLVETGVLTPVSELLCEEINEGMDELQRSYSQATEDQIEGHGDLDSGDEADLGTAGAQSLPHHPETPAAVSDVEVEAAEYLRRIGDQLNIEYGDRLDQIVGHLMTLPRPELLQQSRQQFNDLLKEITGTWYQVALSLLFCQRLIFGLLRHNMRHIQDIVRLTAEIIGDYAANFIINKGGWQSIAELGVMCLSEDEPLLLVDQPDVPSNVTDLGLTFEPPRPDVVDSPVTSSTSTSDLPVDNGTKLAVAEEPPTTETNHTTAVEQKPVTPVDNSDQETVNTGPSYSLLIVGLLTLVTFAFILRRL